MRILSLDISSSTGWALLDTEVGPASLQFGCIKLPKRARDYAEHPWSYWLAAHELARLLIKRIYDSNLGEGDVVVVEETNGGGRASRWSMKFLEYCHCAFLSHYMKEFEGISIKLVYVNTSEWRRVTETRLTKEDKNQNAKLSRHKRQAKMKGQKLTYQDKQAIGIAGKTTIKHVAIRRCKELFNIELTATQDDPADALLMLKAYVDGAKPCTGQEK